MNPQIVLLIVSIVFIRSCCTAPNRVEPPIPKQALGWNYREENGIHIQGDFLLHKGEVINNGRVQIKVLDILPGDPCAEPAHYLYLPSAKLQFIRLSDQKVLCEERFFENWSGIIGTGHCPDEIFNLGLDVIHISAINLTDRWVFFELLD